MNPRPLSSPWTFYLKAVFPIIWTSGFGIATLALWIRVFHDPAADRATPEGKWIFLGMWATFIVFVMPLCVRLKRVRVDEEFLYVSNFRREMAVPFGSIASVTEARWINIYPVTIHFRVPTEFGRRITFMPIVSALDTVADELRHAANARPESGA